MLFSSAKPAAVGMTGLLGIQTTQGSVPTGSVKATIHPISSTVREGASQTVHCNYTYRNGENISDIHVYVLWFKRVSDEGPIDQMYCGNTGFVLIWEARSNGTNQAYDLAVSNITTALSGSSLRDIFSSHSLTFQNFKLGDEGKYCCRVNVVYSSVDIHTDHSDEAVLKFQGEYNNK